jgi:hypothetical protein
MALSNLKKQKTAKAEETKVAEEPKTQTADAAVTPATEKKSGRGSGLKPRVKDPEKAALENTIDEALKTSLAGKKEGLTVAEIINASFEKVSDEDKKGLAKLIRSRARNMGCKPIPVEGTRTVRYTLPA